MYKTTNGVVITVQLECNYYSDEYRHNEYRTYFKYFYTEDFITFTELFFNGSQFDNAITIQNLMEHINYINDYNNRIAIVGFDTNPDNNSSVICISNDWNVSGEN